MEIGMEQKNWMQVAENGSRYLAVYPMLPAACWRLGRANEELEREEPAIDAYRRLLLLDPADPVDIHYRLAKLLQKRDPAEAKSTSSKPLPMPRDSARAIDCFWRCPKERIQQCR